MKKIKIQTLTPLFPSLFLLLFVIVSGLEAATPNPIAEYRFDECSWDGTTGEVEDEILGDNNGTLVDSNITNTDQGKIFHAGFFYGGAIDIDNLDVNTSDGAKTTVAFWMYWDGTDNVFPFGWYVYNLYLTHGDRFGFNTGSGDLYGIDTASSFKNSWHHVVAVFSNGDYNDNKLYIDGEIQTLIQLQGSQRKSNTVVAAKARIGGITATTSGRFSGKIDELKIWNKELSASDINDTYNNEKNGKNWDGTTRTTNQCGNIVLNYKFDAWDSWRSISDRNISTKIINKDFSLLIASLDENSTNLQDFNGTVCVKIDNNITKLDFRDQNETNATFSINRAIKQVKINLSWKKNVDEDCPLSGEDNDTSSTDDFAIRPLKFNIDFNTSNFYAGEEFRMDINSTDYLGENSQDYNETNGTSFSFDINDSNSTCSVGVLGNLPNPLKFNDGNISFDTNYSDVGDVKFTVNEINGSEFAVVDEDDTNDSQRLIEQNSTTINIKPYRFAIINYNFERNPNQNWRYISDVNDSNISISFNIQAQNKMGNVVRKFDVLCYAKDINVSIGMESTSSDQNISYFLLANSTSKYSSDKNLSDFNLSTTINADSFSEGNSSKIIYALNIYRKFNNPINPLDINVSDINTTYNDINVQNMGIKPDNNNSSFYYGKIKTRDIITNKQNSKNDFEVEVFSTTNNHYTDGFHQNSLNWYRMKIDNLTKAEEFSSKAGFLMNSTDKSGLNDINSTQLITSGVISFDIINSWTKSDNAYIHLKIPRYLWYSQYIDYDDSNSSDCSAHPCFKYNYIVDNDMLSIKSGDFNGTSMGTDYNASSVVQRGVKVFR